MYEAELRARVRAQHPVVVVVCPVNLPIELMTLFRRETMKQWM